jgi:hypothetical protein
MKVKNIIGSHGNPVKNQFIITDVINEMSGNAIEYFQSYDSIIAKRDCFRADQKSRKVWLDINYWDYSKTTAKYRNIFLGEDTKTIKQKIKSGEYELVNLNI